MHLLRPTTVAAGDFCNNCARPKALRDNLRLHLIRPALSTTPAYTSIRGDNGRLMSSERSSIVSTLVEDDSSSDPPKSVHKQSEGPRRYAYSSATMLTL